MWDDFLQKRNETLWRTPGGGLSEVIEPQPKGLLPGSFNPLHHGHRELRAAAEAWLDGPVYYELSIANVDKASIDAPIIETRLKQFDESPVGITRAPTFVEKAKLFPGVAFIVGADTALRIVEARYYGGSESALIAALHSIRQAGCRFLVAGRRFQGQFLTIAQIAVPPGYENLFEPLPESLFRNDVSSTELRGLERE